MKSYFRSLQAYVFYFHHFSVQMRTGYTNVIFLPISYAQCTDVPPLWLLSGSSSFPFCLVKWTALSCYRPRCVLKERWTEPLSDFFNRRQCTFWRI